MLKGGRLEGFSLPKILPVVLNHGSLLLQVVVITLWTFISLCLQKSFELLALFKSQTKSCNTNGLHRFVQKEQNETGDFSHCGGMTNINEEVLPQN